MALLFNANNERVDFGSAASLDNLDPITILCWYMPTTLGTDAHLVQKAPDGSGIRMLGKDTTNRLYASLDRATSDAAAQTSTNALSVNTWYFCGCTLTTAGASSDQKLFIGTLTSAVVEVTTYSLQTAGSGSVISDAASNQLVGNNPGGTLHANGNIAWVGIWNRALTLGEIQAQQFMPHVTSGCVLFSHLGFNGTGTQADWSGNVNPGTVTGATVADHVPVRIRRSWVVALPYAVSGTAYNQSVSGGITPTGAAIKTATKVLAGTVTLAGTMINTPTKVLAGTVTLAGALVNNATKILASSVDLSGALVNTITHLLTGTVASAGSLVNSTAKILAGSVDLSGALSAVKSVFLALAGSVASSGTLVNNATKVLASSVAISGALVNTITHLLTGSVASAGSLVNSATKILTGSVDLSGALSAIKSVFLALSGSVTSSGALVRATTHILSGSVASAGTITRAISRILSGAVALSGAVVKSTTHLVSSVVTLAGTLTTQTGTAATQTAVKFRGMFRSMFRRMR